MPAVASSRRIKEPRERWQSADVYPFAGKIRYIAVIVSELN